MNPNMQPLKWSPELAGNPKKLPLFAQELKLKSGQSLVVSDPKALRAMVALMDMQAQMGGAASHWGGPSAFAELMSTFYGLIFDEAAKSKRVWYEVCHFVNDAGHCENGLYAIKANYQWAGIDLLALKKFRSLGSPLTGHGEAHMFPEGVWISNGPLGSGLPQAQGLAMADALAKTDRVTVCAISDGGCMEGEAREALAAIPGFAHRGMMAPFVMVISDNRTKLSGRMEDSFSMEPTFRSLESLGWEVLHLEKGNDLASCLSVWEQALQIARQNPRRPVAIHARTVKGIGNLKTEQSASGGHGFPLKEAKELRPFLSEIYGHQEYPKIFETWIQELEANEQNLKLQKSAGAPIAAKSEKVQVGVSKALLALKAKGLPLVSVTSDLPGSTGLAEFQKKYPESTIDVGIAESNMINVAIGLSKSGFIPVVDTFAQFAITKGNLPLIMSALSQGPVIGVFSHVGFQDAADGASHQALTYFSATAAIPHTDIYSLTCSAEAESILTQAIENFVTDRESGRVPRSQLFFLGRENFVSSYFPEDQKYRLGEIQILGPAVKNPEVTVVATGALVEEALKAQKILLAQNIEVMVIHPSRVNNPPIDGIRESLIKTSGRLITVEDHQITGGMGAILVQKLLQSGVSISKYIGMGVQDEFGQSAYTALELYKKHKLDAESIVNYCLEILKK